MYVLIVSRMQAIWSYVRNSCLPIKNLTLNFVSESNLCFQFDFNDIATITRIVTKGDSSAQNVSDERRPGSFNISYSEDFSEWVEVINSDMSSTHLPGVSIVISVIYM